MPKSPGEALYSGVKEAVNTALGNSGLMATAAKVNGEPIDPRTFAVGALLGGGMAGARETLLRSLPVADPASLVVLNWRSKDPRRAGNNKGKPGGEWQAFVIRSVAEWITTS